MSMRGMHVQCCCNVVWDAVLGPKVTYLQVAILTACLLAVL